MDRDNDGSGHANSIRANHCQYSCAVDGGSMWGGSEVVVGYGFWIVVLKWSCMLVMWGEWVVLPTGEEFGEVGALCAGVDWGLWELLAVLWGEGEVFLRQGHEQHGVHPRTWHLGTGRHLHRHSLPLPALVAATYPRQTHHFLLWAVGSFHGVGRPPPLFPGLAYCTTAYHQQVGGGGRKPTHVRESNYWGKDEVYGGHGLLHHRPPHQVREGGFEYPFPFAWDGMCAHHVGYCLSSSALSARLYHQLAYTIGGVHSPLVGSPQERDKDCGGCRR